MWRQSSFSFLTKKTPKKHGNLWEQTQLFNSKRRKKDPILSRKPKRSQLL
jgi:hypothetical protein